MGWMHERDEHGHHEGYVVAYVPRDWVPGDAVPELHSGWPVAVVPSAQAADLLVREIGSNPLDRTHAIRGFVWVGAACDCGWRSPRIRAAADVEWSPNSVLRPTRLDDALAQLWHAHVEHELRDPSGLRAAAARHCSR